MPAPRALIVLIDTSSSDLTVGAIELRPFGPYKSLDRIIGACQFPEQL
jgi:hypothetical protein